MKFSNILVILNIFYLHFPPVKSCSYRKPSPRPEPSVTPEQTTTTPKPFPPESPHETRLDFVKFKLLESLGLSKPPIINPNQDLAESVLDTLPPLPRAIVDNPTIDSTSAMQPSMVITFGEIGALDNCQNEADRTSLGTISFKLPMRASGIARATVWYFTEESDGYQETDSKALYPTGFCSCDQKNTRLNKLLPNCIRMDTPVESHTGKKAGWKSFNLGFYLQSVVSDKEKLTIIFSGPQLPTRNSKKPFLVLELKNETTARNKRSTRSRDCSSQIEKDLDVDYNTNPDQEENPCCCRTSFYVTIEELGWANWIKFPKGFHFAHCVGRCPNGIDRYNEKGKPDHSLFVDIMDSTMGFGHKPCCVAQKRAPMPIVFFQDNATVNRTVASQFLVQDCGCYGTL